MCAVGVVVDGSDVEKTPPIETKPKTKKTAKKTN
jgi:hypothetical protein